MLSNHYLPEGYAPKLGLYPTQLAIKKAKDTFQLQLSNALNLDRVSAPLFVDKASGLNDDLNGYERPVGFDILEQPGVEVQVVQSLAKWKRYALGRYQYPVGKGIYTDMNAIRRDESTDNLHSVYVDQWDWEKVIAVEQRNIDFLKNTVKLIHTAIYNSSVELNKEFSELNINLPKDLEFITTAQLEKLYPDLKPAQREEAFVKKHGAAFFISIGWPLENGEPHDGRAPDYDDWSLNGDLVYYHKVLDTRLEVSSMGIRVDKASMMAQLSASGKMDRIDLPFHSALLNDKLPLTIGGGIGQSRLCMLLLGKAHVGEVQCGIWPAQVVKEFKNSGVDLL